MGRFVSDIENNYDIIVGNSIEELKQFEPCQFQTCVTSPPYWGLRDYEHNGQIGAEEILEDYIANIVQVFNEVKRVLREDGTLWLNIGDTYTSGGRTWRDTDKKNPARAMSYRPDTPKGLKPKDLIGLPWRIAFALQNEGWYLRSDIIWHKPNCQPESVKDRPTQSHEYIFLLTKSERYFYDFEAIKEKTKDGFSKRNKRSVWNVNTEPFKDAHFAVFP
ncbi:MAG: DNA-methyltransferase, partial [Flavobacteriales bacterium]